MNNRPQSIGILGTLSAFSLAYAFERAVDLNLRVHRGITRRTTRLVLGRKLVNLSDPAELYGYIRRAQDSGVPLLSERAFLRLLGFPIENGGGQLSRLSLVEQSKVDSVSFDYLALFDAFETPSEPFSFRDLILAKKYAELLADGATWITIVRAIHKAGPVGTLTALKLRTLGPHAIVAESGQSLTELNGQGLLNFDYGADSNYDTFAVGEIAESEGRWGEAALFYGRCAAGNPVDATAPFNQGNCLLAAGDISGAATAFMSAIQRDPEFVEAWSNFGILLRDDGTIDAARQNFRKAMELDDTYADAVYNLAALEYDEGNLPEARRLWQRYLELDAESDWARRARAGIAVADGELRRTAG